MTEHGAGVEALRALLAGSTHEFDYPVTPSGERKRYVEYDNYRPDGHWVRVNTTYAFDPNGRAADRWRIAGPRLCVLNTDFSPDEQCYRVAVLADGRVRYSLDAPVRRRMAC